MTECKTTKDGVDAYRMFIDGEFRHSVSGGTVEVENPATEEVV